MAVTIVVTGLTVIAAVGAAQAQPIPPALPGITPPGMTAPTSHPPQPPTQVPSGGTGGGESEVPIEPAKTGAPDWNRFGGDPAGAPRDMNSFVTDVLGWMRTAAVIAGVLGLLTIAAMLVIGSRWRSEQSRRALDSLPAVLLATVISGSAATILSMVL
ncbi:hypothetical protein [Nocardia alni]|uniref:hypothetical protein n=1 Tax=Nocardia alni TaxID=2815723 RepID=UPI001C229415|nr:hypothetical protein [Nocardia alni]